jgi:hypothetical protein
MGRLTSPIMASPGTSDTVEAVTCAGPLFNVHRQNPLEDTAQGIVRNHVRSRPNMENVVAVCGAYNSTAEAWMYLKPHPRSLRHPGEKVVPTSLDQLVESPVRTPAQDPPEKKHAEPNAPHQCRDRARHLHTPRVTISSGIGTACVTPRQSWVGHRHNDSHWALVQSLAVCMRDEDALTWRCDGSPSIEMNEYTMQTVNVISPVMSKR